MFTISVKNFEAFHFKDLHIILGQSDGYQTIF